MIILLVIILTGIIVAVLVAFVWPLIASSFNLPSLWGMKSKSRYPQEAHSFYYDIVTGLPNRNYFTNELQRFVKSTERNKRMFALLYIKICNFKRIVHKGSNKQLLLKQLGHFFDRTIRASDFVARLNDDEFAILLGDIKKPIGAAYFCQRIFKLLNNTYFLDEHKVKVSITVGIAIYPYAGQDAATLIQCAHTVMVEARNLGDNRFQFYTHDIHELIDHKIEIQNELTMAIERNEFYLNYHPIVDINNKNCVGAEVLLRWENPKLGQVKPADFIEVAEDINLMGQLGRWVFIESCRGYNKLFPNPNGSEPFLNINISPTALNIDTLTHDIIAAMTKYNINPKKFCLEFTENYPLEDIESTLTILNKLKALGFSIAVDDFGVSHSSFSYLQNLPIDTIKIEKSFVKKIEDEGQSKKIVLAMIGMAKALNITVIAEGVETQEQENFLRQNGCDLVQGFYYANPMNFEEFSDYIAGRTSNPNK